MSDHRHNEHENKIQTAMNSGVTKFIEVYWVGRVALLQKTVDAIKKEEDPEKLKELRSQLLESFATEDDINAAEAKLTKLLAVAEKLGSTFQTVRNIFKTNRHGDHEGHGH